jgi:hypothetical protein
VATVIFGCCKPMDTASGTQFPLLDLSNKLESMGG